MDDNPAAQASRAMNATINEMMSQSITDEQFGDILEGSVVWEDSGDLIPVAEEAETLDPEPATPAHDEAPANDEHDGD
jgi:hypothetical protein